MLHLQRASAGSGKTYTLAKIYIRNFLAKKLESGVYRLRSDEEIRQAHGRILAITFTNKATNEMKQRIVDSLADLAGVTGKKDKDIAYLSDFIKELKTDKEHIRHAAQVGLKVLLNAYSDFQVSTIDSFFQTILRTLAVETEQNENYQVELNDAYLAQIGVDATLSDVNKEEGKYYNVKMWLQYLILDMLHASSSSSSSDWNPFNRSSNGLYSTILALTGLLNSEIFKEKVQSELLKYFEKCPDFLTVYKKVKAECSALFDSHKSECKAMVDDVHAILDSAGAHEAVSSYLQKLLDFDPQKCKMGKVLSDLKFGKTIAGFGEGLPLNSQELDEAVFPKDKKRRSFAQFTPGIGTKLVQLRNFIVKWAYLDEHCDLVTSKLYYLGLLQPILSNIKKFREENNIIPLSDTNKILQGIIKGSNTPFIYERIGTYINHYLIDEFQDTSRLQWKNLCPLLEESLSRDNDNLIIGDAKQSIYRFRNAESNLIQEVVPNHFGDMSELHGIDISENSNWRSASDIVKFNNYFFLSLSHCVEPTPSAKLVDLYSNVVQAIQKKDKRGYVEINLYDETELKKYYKENSDEETLCLNVGANEIIAEKIHELLYRGYKQRDIALLVNTNAEGELLIQDILNYNKSSRGAGRPQINIISEESLKISNSRAVKIVLSVLSIIAKGAQVDRGDSDLSAISNKGGRKYTDVGDFICYYNLMRSNRPDMPTSELIESYFKDGMPIDAVSNMVRGMKSVALPAFIEKIIKEFVPESLRRSDVAYLAALQDRVLDYCETYSSNVASFMKWWNDSGARNATISSPENSDAVQIMTIHKSKGLEFKCVILPFTNWQFSIGNSKIEWLKPKLPDGVQIDSLPPYIPVKFKKSMLEIPSYKHDYEKELIRAIEDQLNKTYVAFTRAVNELYVYCTTSKSRESDTLGDTIDRAIHEMPTLLAGAPVEELDYTLRVEDIVWQESDGPIAHRRLSIGEPQVIAADKEDKKPNGISDYWVNDSNALLSFRSDATGNTNLHEDDPDPRSRGNLLHAIMESVVLLSDLPVAVEKMRVRGVIDSATAEECERYLTEHIEHLPEVKAWFGEDVQVITERPILNGLLHKKYRPDRLVIDADGALSVVDYKFGNVRYDAEYFEQVSDYITLIKNVENEDGAPMYPNVKGYIWYVSHDLIVPV